MRQRISALSMVSWPTGQENVSCKDAEPQRKKEEEKFSALASLREISSLGSGLSGLGAIAIKKPPLADGGLMLVVLRGAYCSGLTMMRMEVVLSSLLVTIRTKLLPSLVQVGIMSPSLVHPNLGSSSS